MLLMTLTESFLQLSPALELTIKQFGTETNWLFFGRHIYMWQHRWLNVALKQCLAFIWVELRRKYALYFICMLSRPFKWFLYLHIKLNLHKLSEKLIGTRLTIFKC